MIISKKVSLLGFWFFCVFFLTVIRIQISSRRICRVCVLRLVTQIKILPLHFFPSIFFLYCLSSRIYHILDLVVYALIISFNLFSSIALIFQSLVDIEASCSGFHCVRGGTVQVRATQEAGHACSTFTYDWAVGSSGVSLIQPLYSFLSTFH